MDAKTATWLMGTLAFAGAMTVCLFAGVAERLGELRHRRGMHPVTWFVLAALNGLMLVEMQKEFRWMLVDAARQELRDGGVYEERRQWQVLALVALGALLLIGGAAWTWWRGLAKGPLRWALLGTLGALGLFLLELLSLHGIDKALHFPVVAPMVIAWLWAACATCCVVGFWQAVAQRRREMISRTRHEVVMNPRLVKSRHGHA